MADFLEDILTGNGGWSGASGVSGGRGWGASALVMGQLHRAPPTATCAQVACARALSESRPSSFPGGALPPTRHVPLGIDPNVSQLQNTPAVPPHNFSFEILLVNTIWFPN